MISFLLTSINNKRNINTKNNCNFCVEIKYIINGEERTISEKFLCSLNLIKIKNNNVIKFNWAPKLSDLKILLFCEIKQNEFLIIS